MNKVKFKFINFILVLVLLSINLVSITYSKYVSTLNKKVILNINPTTYNVIFHSNNGLDDSITQSFVRGESQMLFANVFSNNELNFAGWNTEIDGSGMRYGDCELVTDLTESTVIHLYAQWVDGVAIVNGTVYDTLQKAINSVPTTGVLTTIILLKDVCEELTILSGKNILFDFGNHTLTNPVSNKPIIENNGTIAVINGNIISDAGSAGTINNRSGGILNISGGRIVNTAGRQAVYNDASTVTISGNAYLENRGTARAALQNQANSTLVIEGGTIISNDTYAVNNSGSLTIGIKDGNLDSSILIRGISNGVFSSANFKYYDGIIEGKTKAISNEAKVVDKETGYLIIHKNDVVDGVNYDKAFLGEGVVVTFNANKGTITNNTKNVLIGDEIGTLPTASRIDYVFLGWYTELVDGMKIGPTTIINENVTFYAHWKVKNTEVAQIGDNKYDSLQEAISACQNNTDTTITMLKNINTSVSISSTKIITLDLNGKTLSSSGSNAVIENSGNLTITNGNINSVADVSAINNNDGSLNLDNVHISITGTKQALFIRKGNVVLDGGSILDSTSSGNSAEGNKLTRATLHALSSATVHIKSASIINTNTNAISNEGVLIVGEKDGIIDNSSITIVGKTNGVETTGTLNFYDGVVKGASETILGTISDIEISSTLVNTTEIINGETYKIVNLQ